MIRLKMLISHAAALAARPWFVSAAAHTARTDEQIEDLVQPGKGFSSK